MTTAHYEYLMSRFPGHPSGHYAQRIAPSSVRPEFTGRTPLRSSDSAPVVAFCKGGDQERPVYAPRPKERRRRHRDSHKGVNPFFLVRHRNGDLEESYGPRGIQSRMAFRENLDREQKCGLR